MTKSRKLSEDELRRAADMYAETKNLASVAREFSVQPSTMRVHLAQLGVKTNGPAKDIALTKDEVWERYKRSTLNDLIVEWGLAKETAISKLEAMGIYYAPADREDIGLMVTELVRQLTARREAMGWTRKQVGGACGVTGSQVGKWEMGSYYPRLPFLVDWGAALGLELVPAEGHGLKWIELGQEEDARSDFLAALYRSGKTTREVAQIAGVTQPTLIRLLKRHGVEMRKRGARPRSVESKLDEEALAALMSRIECEIRRAGKLPKVRLMLGKKTIAVLDPDEG
jgi:transposase-like protein/DNA-binding XRE family transcriptional regulator